MDRFAYLFILFLIYSFLGWLIEVINEYFYVKKFVNRGFLIGPYCPIYGVGVILITSLLKSYTSNPLVLFILIVTICMVLEYITSYILELLFHARWWDYSKDKFNINGRICLRNAFAFGIGGLIIMYIINPLVTSFVDKINSKTILLLTILLLCIFIMDLIISSFVACKYHKVGIDNYKDDTEEFNKVVKEYLYKHSILTKRLIRSFPNAKMKIQNYKNRKNRNSQ